MDVLLGLTGKDFTIVAASKAAMRGVTILKANDDKTRQLSDHTVMAYAGEAGDTVQFSEYIQANISLYGTRNGTVLQPPAIAAFTRNELARALRSRSPYNANCLIGGMVMPPPASQTSHVAQGEKPSSNNPSEPASTTAGTTAAPSASKADSATQATAEEASASKPVPKLYWLDYLATLAPVPYAAHGYAQYYCLSTLDKHHHPDMSLEQGLKVLKMCANELRRRMPIDYKGLNVKVITVEGVKEVEFDDDANIKPW